MKIFLIPNIEATPKSLKNAINDYIIIQLPNYLITYNLGRINNIQQGKNQVH
jgi:hypothetical protein